MFSRACNRLRVFPRLQQFTCFPALTTGYVFSRARHRWHVFPYSSKGACPSDSTSDCFLVICIHSDWSDTATPKPRGLFQRKEKKKKKKVTREPRQAKSFTK